MVISEITSRSASPADNGQAPATGTKGSPATRGQRIQRPHQMPPAGPIHEEVVMSPSHPLSSLPDPRRG